MMRSSNSLGIISAADSTDILIFTQMAIAIPDCCIAISSGSHQTRIGIACGKICRNISEMSKTTPVCVTLKTEEIYCLPLIFTNVKSICGENVVKDLFWIFRIVVGAALKLIHNNSENHLDSIKVKIYE